MKIKLYRKESHYGWTAAVIIVVYVLFMSYFFKSKWADTQYALNFTKKMANIIPAINNLMEETQLYTNFWGVFHAIFWTISPIFLILGFISSFFLPNKKYNNLISAKLGQFVWMVMIMTAIFFYIYFLPILSGFIIASVSQISSLVIFRMIAWCLTAGVIYSLGMLLGASYIRFNLNIKNRKEVK